MSDVRKPVTVLHTHESQTGVTPPVSRTAVLTAAGVIILATVAACLFWFWVLVQLLGLAGELRSMSITGLIYRGDFWDQVRAVLAIFGAVVLTVVSWSVAIGIAEDT